MYTMLKDIMCTPSVSGRENSVCEKIKKYVAPYTDECYTDALGNLIAVKKGSGENKKKIMLWERPILYEYSRNRRLSGKTLMRRQSLIWALKNQ